MPYVYQFPRLLLPLSDCVWKDSDVPLEQRGIDGRFFSQFYEEVLEYRNDTQRDHDLSFWRDEVPDPPDWNWSMEKDLTARRLVEDHILPWTKPISAPLYARIPQASRGQPSVFISYSWDAALLANGLGVIQAVSPHLKAGDFVWADVFCHNQHNIGSVAPQMEAVIGRVKRLLVPRSDPPWYQRCWCIWEVLCAFQKNIEIVFAEYAWPLRGMDTIHEGFLSGFRSIAFAETSLAEDKALILQQAQAMFGSVEAADQYLRSRMKEVFDPKGTAEPPTKVTTYDTLKKIFKEQRPVLSDTFMKDVLWAVYRDPAPTASLTLNYENPPHYDVEVTFDKGADGIASTVRVTDNGDGRPMQTIEKHYSLVEGDWEGKVIQNWQRT
jgi:hypothetical protein